MTAVELENPKLKRAVQDARAFLELPRKERAACAWCRYLREDRETRTFFTEDAMRKTGVFSELVATRVAEAYVTTESGEVEDCVPTSREIAAIKNAASSLRQQLDGAGSWLVPTAKASTFREPLAELSETPSLIPPRSAGRPPLLRRRAFVLRLAESLYELCSSFPIKVLMVATALAWEETGERQIRDILSSEVRLAIIGRVTAARRAKTASDNVTRQLLDRVATETRVSKHSSDERSDPEKLAAVLLLLDSLVDKTASTAMVDEVSRLAQEFGIEPTQSE